MCTTSWTSFRENVGKCQTACALSSSMIRSSRAIVMRNARMGSTNSRTKNKRSLRTGETVRDDELPEDLWPNLNAMVTRLQQLYIGSHEEKLTAREHGFDRDFWAGSPSDRTTKLYRVHVKPRSSMFDPRLCATSPIPVGVEILSREILASDTGSPCCTART